MASIKKLLVSKAPMSYGAMARYPADAALKAKFSTVSRFGDPIQLYEEGQDGKVLFLPRGVCPVGGEDLREDGFPIDAQSTATPKHEEQARVIKECLDLLYEDQSFILQAGTGFGKTVVGSILMCAVGCTTLIIVPKDDLVQQWRKRLLQHTTLKPSQIGLIQQDRCEVYGKSVVIASLKSLSIPDRYPIDIRKYFGLVIFDEVHRLGADTFQTVCRMFPAKLRLGLSATPERIDGKEIVFYANIGPVRVVAKQVPMAPKVLVYTSNWLCPRQKATMKDGTVKIVRMPHNAGRCGHVLKFVTRDMDRNRLLVYLIQRAWAAQRRTVVFSHLTDHLDLLRTLAVKAGVPDKDMGNYYGTMTNAAMDAASVKPVIFATPGKMGEGTDFPWLDACILATPLSGIAQIAGRVLREYPDKRQPVIFDIRDEDSPVFKGYGTRREEYYVAVKADIKLMGLPSAQAA